MRHLESALAWLPVKFKLTSGMTRKWPGPACHWAAATGTVHRDAVAAAAAAADGGARRPGLQVQVTAGSEALSDGQNVHCAFLGGPPEAADTIMMARQPAASRLGLTVKIHSEPESRLFSSWELESLVIYRG